MDDTHSFFSLGNNSLNSDLFIEAVDIIEYTFSLWIRCYGMLGKGLTINYWAW